MNAIDLPTSPTGKLKSGSTYFAGKLHKRYVYARAFVLWFDTFFHPKGHQAPPEKEVKLHTGEGVTGDVIKLTSKKRRTTGESGGSLKQVIEGREENVITDGVIVEEPEDEGREDSFSTGPYSMDTHWKQAVFLLRSPVPLERGKHSASYGMFS